MKLPPELEPIRQATLLAIAPIRPADANTGARKDFLLTAERSEGGRSLPEYYLVYFLLVELLGFRDLGKWEKLAWSVPIDFDGKAFLIEHRKFGVGVFVQDPVMDEPACEEIVNLIKRGVETAKPFFTWLANQAMQESKLNVRNHSKWLFTRYRYFVDTYDTVSEQAKRRADEKLVEHGISKDGTKWARTSFPYLELGIHTQWMAQAAIDAFFSWTEHVFIHLAIITGRVTAGSEVAKLAVANWHEKFSRALDLNEQETKQFYEKLSMIKQQLRNFMAHGAFGKRGEAFRFHSGAGAVPLLLAHERGVHSVSITGQVEFDEIAALKTIEQFIDHVWSGEREPARLYIEESGLSLVLTMAADGTYARAMKSKEEMEEFVAYMTHLSDNAANMDW